MTFPISGTHSTLVTLNSATDQPTTIAGDALLNEGLLVSYYGLTVVNAGRIAAEGASDGITFTAGGSVTNQSGGTISGYIGIYGHQNATVTVVNAGSIAGSNWGVYLRAGGSVTNQSGGAISGDYGIVTAIDALTVVNAGSITGDGGEGVFLGAGGSVTNQSGGTISGSAGAVQFGAGHTGLLAIDPGAVFAGTVDGGNAIGAAYVTTLELASGASAGTLSGLGTQFFDFTQVTVDAGAQWTLAGANTLAAGVTLTNAGALIDAGTLTNFGTLIDAGSLTDAGTLINAGTIAGTNTPGVYLLSGGSITNQSGGTIYGDDGIQNNNGAVVVNAGSIAGYSFGIDLLAGGSVTNQSGGTISGNDGIYTNGGVTVVNAGSVTGKRAGVYLKGAGSSVTNQSGGTISGDSGIYSFSSEEKLVNAGIITGYEWGILFLDGGSVTNQSGGTISGPEGIEGNGDAVTVVNAGSITGSLPGIDLLSGGSVTNQSGGSISGYEGIEGNGDAVTVVNAGGIAGSRDGVWLLAGGGVTNQSGGTISGNDGIYTNGGVTVVNAGSVTASNVGVLLLAGGSVTNQSGGTISGNDGIYTNGGVTVVNAGSVTGKRAGVYLKGAGSSVTNQSGGTISGDSGIYSFSSEEKLVNAGIITGYEWGILFLDGGSVTNQSGGTISGPEGIEGNGDAVTVVNAGSITGSLPGIDLLSGGSVTNQSGGSISGYRGVASYTDAATVVNAGGIAGSTGTLGSAGAGIFLGAGASVTNQSGGTISGFRGIDLTADGTVMNDGSIAGSDFSSNFYINQTYIHGSGVDLAGGSLTNQSGGEISGYFGVAAYTAAATILNAGSIAGRMSQSYYIPANEAFGGGGVGVYLKVGGSITNQSGGTISGWYGILQKSSDSGTLIGVNYGNISGEFNVVNYLTTVQGVGVDFSAGSFTNQSGGTISGYSAITALGIGNNVLSVTSAIVMNAGVIAGSFYGRSVAHYFAGGSGIHLNRGGYVSNESGGTIIGYMAILSQTDRLNLVNAGSIVGGGWTKGALWSDGSGVSLLEGSVTNQASGFISGYWGIYNSGAGTAAEPTTVVNGGTIVGYKIAIYLGGGEHVRISHNDPVPNPTSPTGTSFVTNQSGGTIIGYSPVYGQQTAIFSWSEAVSLVNAGRIEGAIQLNVGGSVTNQSGGTISGYSANEAGPLIEAFYQPLTVVNAGDIVGGTDAGGGGLGPGRSIGVLALAGGSVTNQTNGTISSFFGIAAYDSALTVVNAGTVAGIRDAVYFSSGTKSRLIVDPGAVFIGAIAGGGGSVELASASGAGTLYGFGTSISNFATLQFDSGAQWTVSGNDSASGLGTMAITGFAVGDTIDLTGFVANSETFANNTLVLTDGGGAHETLTIQGTFQTGDFGLSVDGSGTGTDVTVICFAAGTLIDTPTGEVQVEKLSVGDLVLTAHNGPRPVKWIGQGKVLATRGRRTAATPVIVRKGALADNVPNRDLRVTKAHSLYIDDVLIPVEFLVNHRTILWDDRAQEVEIYHVELDNHDVLIANGAPAESYRDDGNRWLFQNANADWHLPPQEPYAPVLTGGPVVDAAWRRLLDRAGPRDLPPLTDDPDLHLIVDGLRVDAEEQQGSVYVFRLPPSPKSVVIASREAVPAEFGIARDPRSLGVALRQVAVRQGAKFTLFDADDERLTTGFHAYEVDGHLRWTDGYAELPAEAFARFDKGAEVMLHLGGATQYPDDRANTARAAA